MLEKKKYVHAIEKRNKKVNRQNDKTESRQMVLGLDKKKVNRENQVLSLDKKNNIYSYNMKGQKYIIVIEDDETCNCDIHDYLKDDEEYEFINCPFCEEEIAEHSVKKEEPCCDEKEIIMTDNSNVCKNCGRVDGYKYYEEWVDFHKNKYKFKRKSIYHRKYYINNKILDFMKKYNIHINCNDIVTIEKIFQQIEIVLPIINNKRKRMINIEFIIKKNIKLDGL